MEERKWRGVRERGRERGRGGERRERKGRGKKREEKEKGENGKKVEHEMTEPYQNIKYYYSPLAE